MCGRRRRGKKLGGEEEERMSASSSCRAPPPPAVKPATQLETAPSACMLEGLTSMKKGVNVRATGTTTGVGNEGAVSD